MANSFTELIVWQKAHKFALEIYKSTESFPSSEAFGLTSQLRRASVSVSSNIVEGSQRGSNVEFVRFLRIARGSLAESQAQLLLARDLGYLPKSSFTELAEAAVEVNKLINGLMKGVSRD